MELSLELKETNLKVIKGNGFYIIYYLPLELIAKSYYQAKELSGSQKRTGHLYG